MSFGCSARGESGDVVCPGSSAGARRLNKGGGAGGIALSYLDQHAGDGHYLLVSTMSLMTNHIQGRSKVNYTDYTPLATLFSEHMTLVVKPDSPLKTGRDIQEKLKRDPQSLSIGVGVTSEKRGEGPLASIPTWKEQGYDVVFSNTRLLFGSKGMSAAQTAYWDTVLAQVVQSKEWKDEAQKDHAVSDYLNSKQSPQRMAAIYSQLKGALVDAGLAK